MGALASRSSLSTLTHVLLNEKSLKVLSAIADALGKIGDKSAIPFLMAAIAKSDVPDSDPYHKAVSTLIEKNRKAPQVTAVVKKKASKKPSKEEISRLKKTYYGKAHTNFVQGNYEEAILNWERLLELDPNHSQSKKMVRRSKAKLAEWQ